MLKNYLKTAWRNIAWKSSFSIINIIGLSIGMAAALTLFVVVSYEMSYEKFQTKYERIYRVVTEDKYSGGVTNNSGIPVPALEALRLRFPDVQFSAIWSAVNSQLTVLSGSNNEEKFLEKNGVFFTEPQLFDIFDGHWLAGNKDVLKQPNTVVLSRSTADRYFGNWHSAYGKMLKINNAITLKVNGVIEDTPPNSDFPLNILVSYETLKTNADKFPDFRATWGSTSSDFGVMALLPPSVKMETINRELLRFSKDLYQQHNERSNTVKTNFLQHVSQVHFDTRYTSFGDHITSQPTLWTLSLIGVFILIMASINFINLATAQAINRSREMGMRKVLGGSRSQLFVQVMGETGLLVFISLLIAVVLSTASLPLVKQLITLPDSLALVHPKTLVLMLVIGVTVTFFAGIYPAAIVSGFKPVTAIKNKLHAVNTGNVIIRRGLVVLQFSISQILIVGTLVAVSQMDFIRNADLGFDKDVVLLLQGNTDKTTLNRQNAFRDELMKMNGVKSVSFTSDPPASDNVWSTNFAFDHRPDEKFQLHLKFADTSYLRTFGLKMLAGRNLSASDTIREGIANETLMHKLGIKNPEDMIGKSIRLSGSWKTVVGVVKDFNALSLKTEMKPLLITSSKNRYGITAIKLSPKNLARTREMIRQKWNSVYPDYAFNASFLDENLAKIYRQDEQLATLYKVFAGLAMLIAGLGLYGLVSFMAVQKTKEVGVRKVLGASVKSIVFLFSKEFSLLVLLSFFIAVPVAWYMMKNWLSDFAYRIPLHAGYFILSVGIALFIAWISVGYKSVQAALANPVKSLRSE